MRAAFLMVIFTGLCGVRLTLAQQDGPPPHARPRPPEVTLHQIGPPPHEQPPSLHPPVKLLDGEGQGVLATSRPLSLSRTCGACHDVAFIEQSNYHRLAFQPLPASAWTEEDFARWEPLVYRWNETLQAAQENAQRSLWLEVFAPRHVGGGFFASVELNCLLCHLARPDNTGRIQALRQGRVELAATATLQGSGLVEIVDGRPFWKKEWFDGEGRVSASHLRLGRPGNDNCRLCHSRMCRCSEPVLFESSLENWSAETTGTVFSPARLLSSGMNLRDKDRLDSPWDVHAERLLGCADCHFAPNNPALDRKLDPENSIPHLAFDARRLSRSEYLWRPDHHLVTGYSARRSTAEAFSGTMRNCADCHRAENGHAFLPFKRTHFAALGCAACHVPRVFTPVRQMTDWTLITPDGQPVVTHYGVQGPVNDPLALIEGVEPALLLQKLPGENLRLQPHTLLSFWYWMDGAAGRPVKLETLKQALFEGGSYRKGLLDLFDANRDGKLQTAELRLDNEQKAQAVAGLLAAAGVKNPRIRAEVRPQTVSHGVLKKSFALRQCTACHHPAGRLGRQQTVAPYAPGGVLPAAVSDGSVIATWRVDSAVDGVRLTPLEQAGFYVHGASRPLAADVLGFLLLGLTVLGVAVHGGLRLWIWRRAKRSQ
jgi:hypothetical protein